MANLTQNSFLYIYFNYLHVSSNLVLIIRRINCINTTSGISHSLSVNFSCAGRKGTLFRPAHESVTDTEWHIPKVVFIQLILLMMVMELLETCHSFIHSIFSLTTGPKPPPKQCPHIVRSRASSFKWEYPLLSLRSSSSFLRLLPRLLATSISPSIFPSITCFRRQFLRKSKHVENWNKYIEKDCESRWPFTKKQNTKFNETYYWCKTEAATENL